MSPPPWIHCNLCFHMMAKKERKFYHLSCRHVLCRPCMAKTNRGTTCPVCKEPLGRFTELNNQMNRKDKMCYDPGALKAMNITCQSVIFQHKHRENLIRGILRCRGVIPQLKEMENALRQRIVATQRQYEKFRTYRRNLQDILRQTSPGYTAAMARRPLVPIRPSPALPTRGSDRDSRDRRMLPSTASSGMFTPALSSSGRPLPSAMQYPRRSNTNIEASKTTIPPEGEFVNDSGISGMRTPASTVSSRAGYSFHHQPSIPGAARRPAPFYCNQMPSTISRR